ncbi:hypothetical protein SK128_010664 [Halocaridina rubra]|uniref:Uncharacterized protein n=1 Tax=Halocaridina rubra TaxID=373956 RepID=A0AAN8XHT2_HALRR
MVLCSHRRGNKCYPKASFHYTLSKTVLLLSDLLDVFDNFCKQLVGKNMGFGQHDVAQQHVLQQNVEMCLCDSCSLTHIYT